MSQPPIRPVSYSSGIVRGSDGVTYRVWVMEEAGGVLCTNPACRKPVTVADDEALNLRFPSAKDKDWVDMMYFCCWDCLAAFVSINDAGMAILESAGPP